MPLLTRLNSFICDQKKVSSIARWPEKRLFFSKKRPKQHEGRDQYLLWKLIVGDFADLQASLPAAPEDPRW